MDNRNVAEKETRVLKKRCIIIQMKKSMKTRLIVYALLLVCIDVLLVIYLSSNFLFSNDSVSLKLRHMGVIQFGILSEQMCSLRGGQWTQNGLLHGYQYYCFMQAADSGSACTNSKQCQGYCYLALGNTLSGTCSKGIKGVPTSSYLNDNGVPTAIAIE